ncbi:MAG: hypothetical protein COU69_01635 [Candidatus Pacebacteria bacterium CG10_big_fil_rev_8_21_14_0_10_56_10]|nr:MAG: hypothetical protein COU69_01635 [Candidatus Pacebacteria bacterium CG10_big_fil_rev_8_21_14_0_10_56_10]
MNVQLDFPFVRLKFSDADDRHRRFLDSTFFKLDQQGPAGRQPLAAINIQVRFRRVVSGRADATTNNQAAPGPKGFQLEDAVRFHHRRMWVADTRGCWAELPLGRLSERPSHCWLEVEAEFDLYTLLTQVLEPLMAVMLAGQGVAMVHASAVAKQSSAMVYPAWRHTGKTRLMLELTSQGLLTDGGRLLFAGWPASVLVP